MNFSAFLGDKAPLALQHNVDWLKSKVALLFTYPPNQEAKYSGTVYVQRWFGLFVNVTSSFPIQQLEFLLLRS